MTAFTLLLLHEVRDRGELVSPQATPIFTDRYGAFLAEGTADEDALLGFWGPPAALPERVVSSGTTSTLASISVPSFGRW